MNKHRKNGKLEAKLVALNNISENIAKKNNFFKIVLLFFRDVCCNDQ